MNQSILWVHAFLSVTCNKYKCALQTLLEFFQLRINGSKYRVQRVESIINISFAAAAAAALFGTLVGLLRVRKRAAAAKLMFIILSTRCTRYLLPFILSWKYSSRVCNANLYLMHVTDKNACTHKIDWFNLGKDIS